MQLFWATTRTKLAVIFIAVFAIALINSPVVYAATSLTAYPVPTASSQPNTLLLGPDGNFWFPEATGDKIGKITPTGVITEYPLAPGSKPAQMAVGPDGNIWFTEVDGNKIGKITMSGVITEYAIPTSPADPAWITAGPDGNMWFTKRTGGVGRIAMDGTITEYAIPSGMPGRITAGPDGNMWFTNNGYFISGSDAIVKITPSGATTEYPIGYGVTPTSIITGPDGNIWFTETGVDKIGKLTPGGALTEYDVAGTSASYPNGLRIGPNNTMWFSKVGTTEISTITTSGDVTDYHLDINTMYNPFPDEFVLMPGNLLWYASAPFNQITVLQDWGPIDPAPAPTPAPITNIPASSSTPLIPSLITATSSAKHYAVSDKSYTDSTYTSPVVSPSKVAATPAAQSSSSPETPSKPIVTAQSAQQSAKDFRPNKFAVTILAFLAVGLLFLLLRRKSKSNS